MRHVLCHAGFSRRGDFGERITGALLRVRLGRGLVPGWRRALALAQGLGLPMPATGASLAYFDGYRTARLPQNLTQAQRDAFGAHTYERTDRPGLVHSEWLKG